MCATGKAAEEADNLFCPATYEVDYASATSPDERRALEAQVAEFGTTPLQLFFEAHPQRLPNASESALAEEGELAERLAREAEAARSSGLPSSALLMHPATAAQHQQPHAAAAVGGGGGGGGGASLPSSRGEIIILVKT